MKLFTTLLLAASAAAQNWSSGHPGAPPPSSPDQGPSGNHGPPANTPGGPYVGSQPPAPPYGPPVVHGSDFVPDEVLIVTYEDTPIACQSRMSTLVNGTSPGPTLRLQPGKTSWVRVYNNMPDYNLTIHWHGLSQYTADFSDGTPSASQWPIASYHFFDYEVHPDINASGTYFYHSHWGFQAVSAAGPLIVEDDGPPPYSYDEERIIAISDYFNKTDYSIQYGLTAKPFVWSGETSAVLINGVGIAKNESLSPSCVMPVIEVEPSKTYRLRFIGMTALSMVQFAIVGHENLTIIAADGQYTQPYEESFIQITTGQRFDVIFKTKSVEELGTQSDFYIQTESKNRPEIYYGYGILRYCNTTQGSQIDSTPATPPLTLTNATYDWLEYALEPLQPNGFPSADEVTRRITIYDRQVLVQSSSIVWHLNDLRWNESSDPLPKEVPYLVNIYENGQAAIPNYEAALNNSGWDPVTDTWPAKIGEVLEIILVNTGSLVRNDGELDYHPFHAHGNHYYDIGSGNGTYDPVANEQKLKGYNPVLRDTTNLYRYGASTTAGANAGWRGWRLRVVQPGVWMIHCHILQHMIMGMQSVWVFGDADEIMRIPHYDAAGYLEYGGSAYGNETFAPSYVHQLGP